MNLDIVSISIEIGLSFLKDKGAAFNQQKIPDFFIAVQEDNGKDIPLIRGVISMYASGNQCSLAHLYTDGTALVGSILYGAAWRAAKALGYKTITI